jgi:hypothetical protein
MALDRDEAVAAAETASLIARSRIGRTASAKTDGTEVCVVVVDHYETPILGAIGIGGQEVTVRACAAPRQG